VYFPGIQSATPLHVVTSSTTVAAPAAATNETWGVAFPRQAYDYTVEVTSGRAWTTLAHGRAAPLAGIPLPPLPLHALLRLRATFPYDNPATLAPILELREPYDAETLAFVLFCGFFAAMSLVNIISSLILRSAPSAWYAGLTAGVVVILVYSWGPLRPIYGGAAPLEQILHSVTFSAYLGCVVAFGIALLGAMRDDIVLARVIIAWYGVNIALVLCEDLLGSAWPLYALDVIALDLLLVLLVVLGVRAFRRGAKGVAGSYLVAFIGPFAGLPLNDLASHHVIAADWVRYTFEAGVAWEASFFAYAVALRNRALRSERDRFDVLAHLDPLTGVSNRRTFDERLESQWAISISTGGQIGLAMIDIDLFKSINDTYGHQHGDDVLRAVARTCAAISTREGDCFARYGGEEFAVILVGTDLEGAAVVGERMRVAIELTTLATISVGVASMRPNSVPGDSGMLVAAADGALYRAKGNGRNRLERA